MTRSLRIDVETTVESRKLPQYLAVLFVTIEAFSIGTYLAWTSPALPLYALEGRARISEQEASWICSLLPLGAVFGTLPAGFVADALGRKASILITALPLFLCWFFIAFTHDIIWIFLARFLGGIACGAASVVIPMYVSEIAEDTIRGSLGTIFQLQITIGILFTYATGFASDLRTITLLCAIPPALLLIGWPFVPESPTWLIMHDRTRDAESAIKRLRGRNYRADDEITRLERTTDTQGARAASILDLQRYGKATVITLGLMVFQQLSGVNSLIFYAETIFDHADSAMSSTACSVVVGVVQVVATYFSTILIDRTGRKILLFLSVSVMAVCMFILSGYFHFQDSHDMSNVKWLPLLSFTIFIVIFSVGFGPIPWLMVGELFTHNVKSAASSVTAICNWILAFFVTKCFQDMVELMGISASFASFGMIGLIGTVFVALMVPETKGKSIEQVQIELYGENDRRPKNTLSRT